MGKLNCCHCISRFHFSQRETSTGKVSLWLRKLDKIRQKTFEMDAEFFSQFSSLNSLEVIIVHPAVSRGTFFAALPVSAALEQGNSCFSYNLALG